MVNVGQVVENNAGLLQYYLRQFSGMLKVIIPDFHWFYLFLLM